MFHVNVWATPSNEDVHWIISIINMKQFPVPVSTLSLCLFPLSIWLLAILGTQTNPQICLSEISACQHWMEYNFRWHFIQRSTHLYVQGLISLTPFHRSSNSMKLLFCSHLDNKVIATKFCTWHDSCAVLRYSKIRCDLMANKNFYQIWIVVRNRLWNGSLSNASVK